MSKSTKPSATNEKATTPTNLEQSTDDLANLADARNQPLVIILAVTLPTLALIGLVVVLIVCYRRRRRATVWLRKIGTSSELHRIIPFLFSSLQNRQVDYKRLLSIFPPRHSSASRNSRDFLRRHRTSFTRLDFQRRKSVSPIERSLNREQKPSSTIDW